MRILVIWGESLAKPGGGTVREVRQVETLEQYKQALASALKARRGYVILELERLDSDGQPMLRIADIEAK